MFKFVFTGTACACLAAGALAHKPAPTQPQRLALTQPIPAKFDLARHGKDKVAPKPALRKLDPASFPDKIDPPSVEMELAPDGPVFSIGALGSKRDCRPKLAHICVDWSF